MSAVDAWCGWFAAEPEPCCGVNTLLLSIRLLATAATAVAGSGTALAASVTTPKPITSVVNDDVHRSRRLLPPAGGRNPERGRTIPSKYKDHIKQRGSISHVINVSIYRHSVS
ncbi:hypothetical protein ABZX88_35830 [Kitasatospora aureofaciens]|uniref:hypothetical protein n=1 Tax=Kitasatospora aureofaciens TaxID=1894 RepID=UPI0033B651F6